MRLTSVLDAFYSECRKVHNNLAPFVHNCNSSVLKTYLSTPLHLLYGYFSTPHHAYFSTPHPGPKPILGHWPAGFLSILSSPSSITAWWREPNQVSQPGELRLDSDSYSAPRESNSLSTPALEPPAPRMNQLRHRATRNERQVTLSKHDQRLMSRWPRLLSPPISAQTQPSYTRVLKQRGLRALRVGYLRPCRRSAVTRSPIGWRFRSSTAPTINELPRPGSLQMFTTVYYYVTTLRSVPVSAFPFQRVPSAREIFVFWRLPSYH